MEYLEARGGAGWSISGPEISSAPPLVRGGARGGVFGPSGWGGVELPPRTEMADEHPYINHGDGIR